MIRIGYVIDTIATPAAGTEKQLLMLLNGLDRTRFHPYLICLHDSLWLRTQRFEFPTIIYSIGRSFSLKPLKRLRQCARLIRDEKLDIVQTFFVDGNLFGTIAARLGGCKIVISSRRNVGDWHNRLHVSILRFLSRWTTAYLANSEAAARKTVQAEGVPASKVTVIYNGLERERYDSLSPDLRREQRREWNIAEGEALVGCVANLRKVKNVDSLIRSAASLSGEFPSVKYVVVGEGSGRGKLQALIDSLSLTDRFHLVGRYLDIVPCLAAFDLAVMCSSFESFSNSLIEYMAAGLPVIASNVGGNGEALFHGQTGLLYEADTQHGLTDSLRKLLSDRPLAARLGQAARNSALSRFSREAYMASHEDYYTNLVERHPR